MGYTIEQWDNLDEYARGWALAPDLAEAERNAGKCTQCGGPASECQDPRNQHAYEVTFRRCYRTEAVRTAEDRRGRNDMHGVVTVVTFNPSKVKPERGAPSG